jgi:hypothetical protein
MRKIGLIVTAMLALMAIYYLAITAFKPSQPQVVVVRPSGAQTTTPAQTPTPVVVEPSAPGPYACVKAVYLKVGTTSVCVDILYSVTKVDNTLQVDFQNGIVHGVFTLVSVPCSISTTPQGILIPCRAQILIPLRQ